jgi:hypothetical protein
MRQDTGYRTIIQDTGERIYYIESRRQSTGKTYMRHETGRGYRGKDTEYNIQRRG